MFIFLFWRERVGEQGRCRDTERDGISSRLSAVIKEPDMGIKPMLHEMIMAPGEIESDA